MRCPVCEYPMGNGNDRRLGYHRKYFALLNLVYQHQDKYADLNSMRKEVIMRTGRFVVHHHVTGVISYHPASMSFAAMDQCEFRLLVQQSIDVCLKHLCDNMSNEQLWDVAGFF